MARIATPRPSQYGRVLFAETILDAVEQWADGCLLLRETGIFHNGRLDGLLVPGHWKNVLKDSGFFGVEVKVSRSDFLAGLSSGQFDRYSESLNGLYIATDYGVCKTDEIPRQYGHLIIGRRGEQVICVCKRHARFTKRPLLLTDELFWRWVIDIGDQFSRRHRESEKRVEQTIRNIRSKASDDICGYLTRLRGNP